MKAHPHWMKSYLLTFVVALLLGCAQMGLTTPESLTEKVAAAKALNTQVVASAVLLLNARKISSADGENVLKAADTAKEGIDVAQTIAGQDPTAAQARLTMVSTVLVALRSYLAVHQAK